MKVHLKRLPVPKRLFSFVCKLITINKDVINKGRIFSIRKLFDSLLSISSNRDAPSSIRGSDFPYAMVIMTV